MDGGSPASIHDKMFVKDAVGDRLASRRQLHRKFCQEMSGILIALYLIGKGRFTF